MSFTLPTLLTLGLPLIALPLLIHLINLRRHRRVEWAAMEFLLESQKRNKKWIFLRQLLLLTLRTAAIALVVFMLAGPVATSAWARIFGRGVTHHLILLDDSYSMSDRWDTTTAWAEAKRAVATILEQAGAKPEAQLVTLVRFSEAEGLSAGAGSGVDRRPLNAELLDELGRTMSDWAPAESSAGPIEALQAAARLPEPGADETRIAYMVSDFRRAQWTEDAQLQQLFGNFRGQVSQLQLIQCVDQTRPNLAVAGLEPESGLRAAGVESWMSLTVANYGDSPAAGVTVEIAQDGVPLPAVEFDAISPGDESTRRFRVTFADAGPHQITARFDGDAIAIDNVRHFAANIPAALPVLIVDGSERGDDGDYLRAALSPGGRNLSGWVPQVERPSFLRRHDQLPAFAAIFMLDVPRLDQAEIDALEGYVAEGGGLAMYLGPGVLPDFYNQFLYRGGEGLFPAPLDVPTQLLRDGTADAADLVVSDHPLFHVFRGKRNSFLAVVDVDFYYALEPAWSMPDSGDVNVLASLRNRAPLILEKRLGAGRVVVQLCKLAPKPTDLGVWSNWGVNPVFPVYANELVGYLSSARRSYESIESGDVVRLELPEADYEPEVEIVPPGDSQVLAATVLATAADGKYLVEAPSEATSGVWSFQVQPREGDREQRLLAVNVPRGDGDLHHLDRGGIDDRLPDLDYQFSFATQLTAGGQQLAGFRLSDSFLYLLIAALVGEQLLAVSASYHGRSRPRTA